MEARDEVNQAMIRHWIDAMGDDNPVYVDEKAARANGFPGVVAPPTMLQAWIMRGYLSQPGGELEGAPRRVGRGLGPGAALRRVRRGRVHVGGGHQLRPGVRPAHRARGPAHGVLGHRLGVAREAHRAGRRPLRHHPPRVHRPARRARGHHAVPHPALPAPGAPSRSGRRPAAAPSRHHPRHRLLLRGRPAGHAAHPALCAPAACCATRPARRARRAAPSSGTPSPPAGAGTVYSFVVVHHPQVARLRLPAAHRRGRARGGDAPRGRPHRRRPRRRPHRHAGGGRDGGGRRRAHDSHVPARSVRRARAA